MALNVGSRLGHYDVTALIGEGGMGQVYQATDTQLKRQVALKILPEAFASDPDRLARFQREAQVLASLNHPGIAAIYGIEEAEGTRALVLELVEGPTLADRIAHGPIPIDEALPIAKQIAEAVEAAHEAGVIHRDLKPANIKVREDGTVKVLDFGLAKALAGDKPGADLSQSPTVTATVGGTREGVILGTAAYMSPEQARGKLLDRRTDIWSFGCVLYEILTGRSPFVGETLSDTIAQVLDREPDLEALPTNTPALLRRLLRRCLDKDPRERLRDIGDARVEIREAVTAPLPESVTPVPAGLHAVGWRQSLPWALGTLIVSSVITGLAVWSLRPAQPLSARLAIVAPPGVQPFGPVGSPDGRMIAFRGDRGGQFQTFVRNLNQLEAVPLSGTEGAYPESFSPDGQWLLINEYTAAPRMLKRVPLAGGPTMIVGEALGQGNLSATWGPDDTIILGSPEGLWSMPVSGRRRTQLTTLAEGEVAHAAPRFLPSGRAVLFHVVTGQPGEAQVAVYNFDTSQTRVLLPGSSPQFATSGHLVFWRQESLWAVPFDPDRLEVGGEPLLVVENVPANRLGFGTYDLTSGDGQPDRRPDGRPGEQRAQLQLRLEPCVDTRDREVRGRLVVRSSDTPRAAQERDLVSDPNGSWAWPNGDLPGVAVGDPGGARGAAERAPDRDQAVSDWRRQL